MFKTATVYSISGGLKANANEIDYALEQMLFTECGPTQERSIGWIPPRGEKHGAMLETIGRHWIAKLMIENKAVPGAILKRKADDLALHIEQTEGRKPGKKERKELRENALLELLPMAFAKQTCVLVWIDPEAGLLVLDTASAARVDEVVSLLIQAIPGLVLNPLQTALSPTTAMSGWLLSGDSPEGFTVDRECELKSCDENKATVRYAKHSLDIDEVRHHIETGKVPTKLAMTWEGRVSFVLTDKLAIKKILFLDSVMATEAEYNDSFDADVAISAGELRRMLTALFKTLGGRIENSTAEAQP